MDTPFCEVLTSNSLLLSHVLTSKSLWHMASYMSHCWVELWSYSFSGKCMWETPYSREGQHITSCAFARWRGWAVKNGRHWKIKGKVAFWRCRDGLLWRCCFSSWGGSDEGGCRMKLACAPVDDAKCLTLWAFDSEWYCVGYYYKTLFEFVGKFCGIIPVKWPRTSEHHGAEGAPS